MQRLADELARVDAVDRLGDRAQGAGQAQAAGDDLGDLDGGRRHQPDPLARVQVGLGEGAGAGPDALGHVLVVDLLADRLEFGDAVALDDRQGGVAGLLHVLGVLDPGQPEPCLLPGELRELAGLEELPLVQASPEVEERGALHDGVVQVEEGGGLVVAVDRELWFLGRAGSFLRGFAGCLRRGLACQNAPRRGGAPTGSEPSESGHGVSIASLFGGSGVERFGACELSASVSLKMPLGVSPGARQWPT